MAHRLLDQTAFDSALAGVGFYFLLLRERAGIVCGRKSKVSKLILKCLCLKIPTSGISAASALKQA
jgi:hypothetical protein